MTPSQARLASRCAGIRKAFGATVAVDGVDVSVRPGEVCAIVGQNGAGKSTLMAILSGALQPDAGRMTLDGAPYRPCAPARRAPSRRGDDLPGAVARAASDRGREHPARHGARALRAHPARRDAPDGHRRARAPRPSGDFDRRRRSGRSRLPPSNWSRSAGRSQSGAGCSCSTNRRAACRGRTPSGCSCSSPS